MAKRDKLQIIIPCYNEEEVLDELFKRLFMLKKKMQGAGGSVNMEFICVNDGSRDSTLEILKKYARTYKFFKVLSFSRNFGHQIAVSAGLDYATGDYVAIIDADLQDPPELVEKMYKKVKKEKLDVVYGRRRSRKGETIFKLFSAKLFYRFLSLMCNIEIPPDTGDFRLMNNSVLNAIQKLPERHRFLRGMFPWIGFKSAPLYYERQGRFAGKTKYPIRKMVRFSLDAIFSFSNKPLRLATYVGLFTFFLGIAGGLIILYIKLFTDFAVEGITTVILSIIIIGGIQIIMLGVIGEYIARIFEESKARPLYIVSDMCNFPKQNRT